MLNSLVLNNFPSGYQPVTAAPDNYFVLRTCQRTLFLSFEHDPINQNEYFENEKIIGLDAYLFLLETISGLKSKLIGENEIVGQFKDAFSQFLAKSNKDTQLIKILEKLFKDAKTIRTDYLLGLSQKTYASIARKFIYNQHKAKKVLILGSGALAEDLINQFKKKTQIAICARNNQRIDEFTKKHEIELVEWFNVEKIQNYQYIVNTIGSTEIIFDSVFFNNWNLFHAQNDQKKLFVDLGSPSCLSPEYAAKDYVLSLQDVFNEGAVHEDHKINQINKARSAMNQLIEKRNRHLNMKMKNSMQYKKIIAHQENQFAL